LIRMTEITLNAGETRRVVNQREANIKHEVEVTDGEFRLAHSEAYAKEGRLLETDRRGNLNPKGQEIWVYCENSGTIRIDQAQFELNLFAPLRLKASKLPKDEIATGILTLDGTTQQLPSISASDLPFGVLIQNDPSNSGAAAIGDANNQHFNLQIGESIVFNTTDADILYANGTAGDQLNILAED